MKLLINDLLKTFRASTRNHHPEKISFLGVDGFDVYNPSTPFLYDGQIRIAGRVEKRDSEQSMIRLFDRIDATHYALNTSLPHWGMQDPFVTQIGADYLLGGTYVNWEGPYWFTRLYKGPSLSNLTHWVDAPKGMKDVRVIALNNGSIGVLTRPQGGPARFGVIGFTRVESAEKLTEAVIAAAPLLDIFEDNAWAGANDAVVIDDHHIGVVGHVALFSDDRIRHYYAMSFVLNIYTLETSDVKIIGERAQFLDGPAKRDDLHDVIFTAGMDHEDGQTYLYVGTSDAEVQRLKCENPFA
jgi:hypothetical protein